LVIAPILKATPENTILIIASGNNMTIESQEKALPGYKSLADVQKELILEQRLANELSRLGNLKADRLIELGKALNVTERKRLDLDIISHDLVISYRKKASRATWMQVFVGVAALGIAVIALYSGAVDINSDNPLIIMITNISKELMGEF
jgi:hypothetical protein